MRRGRKEKADYPDECGGAFLSLLFTRDPVGQESPWKPLQHVRGQKNSLASLQTVATHHTHEDALKCLLNNRAALWTNLQVSQH